MARIKFYSVNDLSSGYNLSKIEKLLTQYHEGKEVNDINDIIELYNINKFFENKMHLTNWTFDDIDFYEKTAKSYLGVIARFIKSIMMILLKFYIMRSIDFIRKTFGKLFKGLRYTKIFHQISFRSS